jgi:hypothetical protein
VASVLRNAGEEGLEKKGPPEEEKRQAPFQKLFPNFEFVLANNVIFHVFALALQHKAGIGLLI